MAVEPGQNSVLEFLRCGGHRAAMVRARDSPELQLRIVGYEAQRVAERDVAVHYAMNEQDGNMRVGDGVFGRGLRQVDLIFGTRNQQRNLDNRTQDSSSKPRPSGEALPHAIVSDLAKS